MNEDVPWSTFLPDALHDEKLGAEEPPLPFQLSSEEINELSDPRAVAGTRYGRNTQDKISNEDFSISAIIRVDSLEYSFAAVSDGVSTRTFFFPRAHRGSLR